MIAFNTGDAEGANLLVVPVLVGRIPASQSALQPDLDDLDAYLDLKDFSGKSGQTLFVPTPGAITPEVLLVGLGDEVDAERIRRIAGSVARVVSRYVSVATLLSDVDVDGADAAVALGTLLGSYSFDEYRSEVKTPLLETMILLGEGASEAGIDEGVATARGVVLARDLVNRPAADKPPTALAAVAMSLPDEVEVRVYDEDECREAGFNALLGVNAGADRPARMVVMQYQPAGATGTLAFVGKGIVFDSGGLSIKPAVGMETMKTDMGGAAAVIGAMQVIAELGLLVNVIGITPLTENLVSGSAQRPGDVVRAYNGKTIEVLNTDAEGRLVLADGLSLALEFSPDLIVDIATLTGGCKVALGSLVGGLFSNDDEAADAVGDAATAAGEKLWRMPVEQEYRQMIDSDIADMKNTSGRWASPITAALLLEEFVDDRPWVHLDIAGPGRVEKTDHYLIKGASGFGVRTLVSVAQSFAD
ncbi:MAG: leucyl aminopeptidase [Acidimicrobiia bacterium]